ncbi:enediyne antibiotic chromoprotein [Micromonospora sp. DR5-3]|uniref:enediyne antibiotic chromoprotein n=1 Tax=unclassified Micromonospora TaxID=2617518 RepID=UPI0011DB15A3|nr:MULTISPECIES: enediyne antibiotic chromoprotein [unclassified Micromonospora]MCW3818942.1 enediyne antibiotic chromoprotein [Micromonospora sp. DR5-3]TYC21474.1 hypothetical protein FXF52_25685 [Micromonospora sp. MP36]
MSSGAMIRLARAGITVAGVAALSFFAAAPALADPTAEPSVSVNPSTDLKDGQSVTVSGAGYTAGQDFYVVQCGELQGAEVCDWVYGPAGVVDADGKVAALLNVKATFIGYDENGDEVGPVDCTAAGSACTVGVFELQPAVRYGATSISFTAPA